MNYQNHIHYSLEIEKAILGACILEKTAFSRVYSTLKPEMFYGSGHKQVFETIVEMFDKNIPIDMETLWDFMYRVKGIKEIIQDNTAYFVTRLTNSVVSSANIEYHALVIQEMYLQRELIKLTEIGNSKTSAERIQAINNRLNELQAGGSSGWKSMDQLMVDLYKHQDKMQETGGVGVPTGLKTIDRVYGGFHKGQMIVIGARPSMGKSALAGQIAMNMAANNFKVGIISLEMNNNEIAARLAAIDTVMDFKTIYRGLFSDENERENFYKRVNSSTAHLPIFISDKTNVNISAIKAQALKLKYKQGLDCLIVDYLQLIQSDQTSNRNRENAVSEMSRGFKILCKELDIPGIILCQLNRESLKRKGAERFPQLSDVRESGSIEQDADAVMFLHQDYMIGLTEDEDGNSTQGKAHLIIRKWRNGEANLIIDLSFNGPKMMFSEVSGYSFKPVVDYSQDNPF